MLTTKSSSKNPWNIRMQLQKGFNPNMPTRVHYQGLVESNSAVSLLKKKGMKERNGREREQPIL